MNQIIKKLIIILIYIGLILISTKVYAITGITTNETTRLRKSNSTDSDTIALVPQDTEVEIISEEGDWYKVTYANNTGYIRKDMLSTQQQENTTEQNAEDTTQVQEEQTEEQINSQDGEEQNNEETQNNTNNQTNQVQEQQEIVELTIGYTANITSNLDIKILPSINSNTIATISENTNFTIVDIINKWCYIETQNNSGWILLNKIKNNNTTIEEQMPNTEKQEQQTEDAQTLDTEKTSAEISTEENTQENTKQEEIIKKYVATETLNMRENADNNANIIDQLTLNTEVTIEENVDSTWSKISVNGITGYVASKYLSDTKTTVTSRSEEITRENTEKETNNDTNKKEQTSNKVTTSDSGITGTDVANYAKQYLGYKYVSGGTSPTSGFDCSGFTYYVYKHFGITLSRTSSAQISNGVAVDKSNLQAGDLVIFNNSSNSSIGHVGIYLGGDSFIHAANASKGVVTTSLSNSYYEARFVAARRVTN